MLKRGIRNVCSTVTLYFTGKPFPVRNCTLSNQTSNSVEVTCLPGFDGGLPQHFLLELYTTSSSIPRYNMTSFIEPYFFLDNLEPDVTFRIVVFAVNAKGRSSGVILEEVTFRDAEKRTGNTLIFFIMKLFGFLYIKFKLLLSSTMYFLYSFYFDTTLYLIVIWFYLGNKKVLLLL